MTQYKFCPQCSSELAAKKIDGFERLACPNDECDFVFWNNPTPVVAAIVVRDGEVIIARNKLWPEKMFGLITGFLEQNEDPKVGVVREVQEELGLLGEVMELVSIDTFEKNNQLILTYQVNVTGEVKLGDELAEYKSIPIEKVRPWPVGTGLALAKWLDKQKEKRAS